MVNSCGLDGNVGHEMTDDDKIYREIVKMDVHNIDNYAYYLTRNEYEPIHHHTWLQLMGLMETWDIV